MSRAGWSALPPQVLLELVEGLLRLAEGLPASRLGYGDEFSIGDDEPPVPVQQIEANGMVEWYLDQAAAAGIEAG